VSRSAFRSVQVVKHRHTTFHSWVGLVRIQQKPRRVILCRTCVFAFGGICGSPSAYRCVRGTKHRRTIFHAGWDQHRFLKNRLGTCYAELVFLHQVGPAGRVVHSSASGARYVDALLFILEWDQFGFKKKRTGRHYSELVFSHSVGSVVHSGAFVV
jgi:hypothetical protein